MSTGQWIATGAILVVALELWSGVAIIPWSAHRRPWMTNTDPVVHRDEQEFAYWLAIVVHTMMVALTWFILSSKRLPFYASPDWGG